MIPDIFVVNWFVAGGPNPFAVLALMVKEYVVPGYRPKNRKQGRGECQKTPVISLDKLTCWECINVG